MRSTSRTIITAAGIGLGAGFVGYHAAPAWQDPGRHALTPVQDQGRQVVASPHRSLLQFKEVSPPKHPKLGWRGRPVWSEADLKKWATGPRSKNIHTLHFKARLTVNGFPVVFDEFVECRRVFAKPRKDYRRRLFIMKKLPDDSVVYTVFLPALCFTFQKSWNRFGLDLKSETIPSSKFLMRYYWADHYANPTRIEGYLSHAYHKQKKKRLVLHSQSVRLAPYPTPIKILREAERQARADLQPIFLYRRSMEAPRWVAQFAIVLPKSDWMKNRVFRPAVQTHSKLGKLTDFDDTRLRKDMFVIEDRVGIDWQAFRKGIPHPGKHHHLLSTGKTREAFKHITGGLAERTRLTLDKARPVDCQKGVCEVLLRERGYLIFVPNTGKHSYWPEQIKIEDSLIPFRRPARLLFWRPDQLLIALNLTKM